MMKCKYLILLIFILLISSCIKKTLSGNNSTDTDVIYTDSFTPSDWENPFQRKQIITGDKDIGNFIKDDVMDPKIRNLLIVVTNFFQSINNTDKTIIKKYLNESAYNSFIIRFQDLSINDDYKLKVEQPFDMNQNTFWLKFKLTYPEKSYIGRLELDYNTETGFYMISDFENEVFDDLKNSTKKIE